MGLKRADIELHIEELVLEGFAPGDRHLIGAAVQRELTRLLAEQGARQPLHNGGEIARVDVDRFEQRRGASSDTVGAETARAVY